MNLDDVTMFSVLHFRLKRSRDAFLKVNNIKNYDNLRLLMWINYVISIRGHCHDADIAYIFLLAIYNIAYFEKFYKRQFFANNNFSQP